MALPVLDGNQSATTLSSVVTGGEHIVANSVVCLGSTAIANITNAVSGSVVSISNFPSTQTIAGVVTANLVQEQLLTAFNSFQGSYTEAFPVAIDQTGFGNVPISGTVTVGNSVTIGSLPAINGTVTANVFGLDVPNGTIAQIPVHNYDEGFAAGNKAIPVLIGNENGGFNSSQPLPISGTVTANGLAVDTVNAGAYYPIPLADSGEAVIIDVRTFKSPSGPLTTRFGTPTTASVAFATSCVTNANRKYLLIQNVTTGSNVITVGIGFTPTTTQGIQLTAGAGITFESSYIPTGAVQILSSVTASNFTILEA